MKKKEKQQFPGYPSYPQSEDIYKRERETDLDPDQPGKLKTAAHKSGKLNEKDFKDDVTGGDLDVPGTELDDAQEEIGSEDEENNLYSFGSDNHAN